MMSPFFSLSIYQVRYTQLVRQKKRKPIGRSVGSAWRGVGSVSEGRLGARGGSRRSGYAFAHQEGFGELITSGKNMRLSSLALASFASRHSSSWIDTLRRKKHTHTHTPPSASGECSPAPSCVSGSLPPLSNSSSVLGGSQETPIEEETAPARDLQPVVSALSTKTHPAAAPGPESAAPQGPAQAPSSSVLGSSAVRCHGATPLEAGRSLLVVCRWDTVIPNWTKVLKHMRNPTSFIYSSFLQQEALFGWKGFAARSGASNSQGLPPVAKETSHIEWSIHNERKSYLLAAVHQMFAPSYRMCSVLFWRCAQILRAYELL